MTTVQLPADKVDEIVARAREVKFSRVLVTLILGFFYAIGWLAGHAWVGVVMCALSARRGWLEGQGIADQPQSRKRAQPV